MLGSSILNKLRREQQLCSKKTQIMFRTKPRYLNAIRRKCKCYSLQFHPMIPSATVKGPDVELVITETLRPMIPTSPTPRSSRWGSCIMGSEFDSIENEKSGFACA